ncbi:MAG: hypothetical protein QM764_17785 [Chitinophagaceae bacterium]
MTDAPDGIVISADSYYNPFGVAVHEARAISRTRLATARQPPRAFGTNDRPGVTGFKGSFGVWNDQQWNWEVGMDYGHVSIGPDDLRPAEPEHHRIRRRVPRSSTTDGVVKCGTPDAMINDCTPINIFNLDDPNTITVAAVGRRSRREHRSSRRKRCGAPTSNGGLFELPAGTMQLAIGASYRKEYTHSNIDTRC